MGCCLGFPENTHFNHLTEKFFSTPGRKFFRISKACPYKLIFLFLIKYDRSSHYRTCKRTSSSFIYSCYHDGPSHRFFSPGNSRDTLPSFPVLKLSINLIPAILRSTLPPETRHPSLFPIICREASSSSSISGRSHFSSTRYQRLLRFSIPASSIPRQSYPPITSDLVQPSQARQLLTADPDL